MIHKTSKKNGGPCGKSSGHTSIQGILDGIIAEVMFAVPKVYIVTKQWVGEGE